MRFQKHIKNFDKDEILKLNKEGKNLKDIANIVGIPGRRLGEMVTYFKLDVNSNFIIPINHDYFNVIDTEAKAYLLGYTIADGNVYACQRKVSMTYRLCYCSSVDDREVIELLQREISPSTKIFDEHNTKGAKNRKPQLKIRFQSTKLCKDLIDKYDVIPNKTVKGFSFRLPQIDSSLMNHLIRGIFDGDGCIGNPISFSLNSKFLCEDIITELSKTIPNIKYKIREIQGKTCVYYTLNINLGRKREIMNAFGEYIYNNATYYLTRKKNKF